MDSERVINGKLKKYLTRINGRIYLFVFLAFCFLSFLPVYAFEIDYRQSAADGGLPGEYLTNFSASVRALGMGKAYTGLACDPTGVYWNPAGLAGVTTKEASFLYSRLYMGTRYSFVGYAHPFALHNTLGVSWVSLGTGNLEKTNVFGDNEGNFSDLENCYIISYGCKVAGNMDAGVNVKLLTQDLDTYSAFGYGMDIGMMYQMKFNHFLEGLNIGLSMQNVLQPRMRLKEEVDVYPMNLKTGLAFRFLEGKLLWAGDINMLNLLPDKGLYEEGKGKRLMKWHTGMEYNFMKMFSVRCGIDYKELSGGVGVKTRNFSFDYACGIHTLELTHRFGISARFGMLPTAEEEEIAKKREELEIEEHYQNGLRLFNKEKYNKAKEEVEKALLVKPRYKKARDLLNQVELAIRKEEAQEHIKKALVYFSENKNEEAQGEINKAEELDPECKGRMEEEYFKEAQEYLEAKEYKKSKEKLVEVLYINGKNKEALSLLKKLTEMLKIIK